MESGKSRRGERFIQRLVPSKGSLRSLQVLLLTILLGDVDALFRNHLIRGTLYDHYYEGIEVNR